MPSDRLNLERFVAALLSPSISIDLAWMDIADALFLASVMQGDDHVIEFVDHDAPTASIPLDNITVPTSSDRTVQAISVGPYSQAKTQAVSDNKPAPKAPAAPDALLTLEPPAWLALPGRAQIARAFRPLGLHRSSRRRSSLDLDATITAACDTGLLLPVMRPDREALFDIAIVADDSATMRMWSESISALADLLERHGSFRAVSRWTLGVTDGGTVVLRSHAGVIHAHKEISHASGQRLIIVVTDSIAAHWREPAIWDTLQLWGSVCQVGLLHLLPQGMWSSSCTGEADAAVRPEGTGGPTRSNSRLKIQAPWWWDMASPPRDAIPMVGLDEASISAWAQVAAGRPTSVARAILPPSLGDGERTAQGSLPSAPLGDVVRSTVSPLAYRLAALLSAVDASLPVARVVMASLLPDARHSHLAELLAAGVLLVADDPADASLEFPPSVRETLQASLTTTDVLDTWRAVAAFLAASGRDPQFSLIFASEPISSSLTLDPMAQIASDLANRLGLRGRAAPSFSAPAALGRAPRGQAGASSGPVTRPAERDGALAEGPVNPTWVIAIYSSQDPLRILGSGSLIDRRRVLTSAHVVDGVSLEDLRVAFPYSEEDASLSGLVASVRRASDAFNDVAILEVAGVPSDAQPVQLDTSALLTERGHRWWARGYRDGAGTTAVGTIGPQLGYGAVRLELAASEASSLGFSGAGVWSLETRSLVAVIGQTDARGDLTARTLQAVLRALPDENLEGLARDEPNVTAPVPALPHADVWMWSLVDDEEGPQHWIPRAKGLPGAGDEGWFYTGRSAALRAIIDWLGAEDARQQLLFVVGAAGAGKSSVLARIVMTADASFRREVPYDDLGVKAPVGLIGCAINVRGKTALDVARELARAVGITEVVDLPRVIQEVRERVMVEGGPLRVIVDGVDQAASSDEVMSIVKEVLLPLADVSGSSIIRIAVGIRTGDYNALKFLLGSRAVVLDLDSPEFFDSEDLFQYTLKILQGVGKRGPFSDIAVASPYAERLASSAGRSFGLAAAAARSSALLGTTSTQHATEPGLGPSTSTQSGASSDTSADFGPDASSSALVRPYARTGGRTRPGRELDSTALIRLTANGRESWSSPLLNPEHVQVIGLFAGGPLRVGDVATQLSLPIGVARVILGDMIDLGLLAVDDASSGD